MIQPILRDFPDQFETARLLIRAPRAGDGAAVREAALASCEHLQPWMPWAADLSNPNQQEQFVRQGQANFIARRDLTLLLFLKESQTFIGGSGLHRIDWSVPKFEIGYWIHRDYEGQGYVTEAVNGITQFAFEQLGAKRIEIRCDTDNERSAAVARRCGYTLEGTFRHDRRHHLTDQLGDTHIFAKIAP